MSEHNCERDRELEGVLRQVSAQLRGSLGNIYGALSRIAPPEARDEDGKMDMDAAVLCQSYYRILRLANNLADAANLDGPSAARLRNEDIVGLCREATERAEVPAELLGIALHFKSERPGHVIAVDGERIERLLLNLLSNAFKFIGTGEKRVTVEVRVGRDQVELSVSDTGVGIAPELQKTVFDRYLHTDRLDPPPHGLGLGLPICRRIAREHGGSLLLTSEAGRGTTVTVSLPNRREKVQPLRTYLADLGGGYNRTIVELADALPKQAFTQKYLD